MKIYYLLIFLRCLFLAQFQNCGSYPLKINDIDFGYERLYQYYIQLLLKCISQKFQNMLISAFVLETFFYILDILKWFPSAQDFFPNHPLNTSKSIYVAIFGKHSLIFCSVFKNTKIWKSYCPMGVPPDISNISVTNRLFC